MKRGDRVVVRSSLAGVFFGTLEGIDGDNVTLRAARKAWSWDGAFAVEGLATHGPAGGKFTAVVSRIDIFGVCQVLSTTDEAVKRWDSVMEHRP